MIDRPAPIDLLTAMATTLSDNVVPACTGAPQHAARVVANLCRVLAREIELGAKAAETTIADLQEHLSIANSPSPAPNPASPDDRDDLLAELVAALDTMLAKPALAEPQLGDSGRTESGPPADRSLHDLLVRNVDQRLAIAKPGYR